MKKPAIVVANDILVFDTHKMTFDLGTCDFSPGQYADIYACGIGGPYQVCEFDSNRFTIVFPIIDRVSEVLASLKPGDEAQIVPNLGNGFDLDKVPDEVCLVADELGMPEMLGLARSLVVRGKKCKLILGYRNKDCIFMLDSFRNLVNEIEVLTLDGSNGRQGSPADAIKHVPYICAGGTPAMLKELAAKSDNGQFSFAGSILAESTCYDESFIETTEGRLNCRDAGPVFDKNIIIWDKLVK